MINLKMFILYSLLSDYLKNLILYFRHIMSLLKTIFCLYYFISKYLICINVKLTE